MVRLWNLSSLKGMVEARCCVCCQAHQGLTVGFILLRYLLIPYLCSVSFLYLDLCVLGDNSWMGWGSFMRAKPLCVLVPIAIKGGVGTVELVQDFQ